MTVTEGEKEEFIGAYIAAMLWSSHDLGEDDACLDEKYGPSDFAPAHMAKLREECTMFLSEFGSLIRSESHVRDNEFTRWQQAGHDFWLTRAGHGAGFWDGDWPVYGDALTLACKDAAFVSMGDGPYVGDDGKIYVFGY